MKGYQYNKKMDPDIDEEYVHRRLTDAEWNEMHKILKTKSNSDLATRIVGITNEQLENYKSKSKRELIQKIHEITTFSNKERVMRDVIAKQSDRELVSAMMRDLTDGRIKKKLLEEKLKEIKNKLKNSDNSE